MRRTLSTQSSHTTSFTTFHTLRAFAILKQCNFVHPSIPITQGSGEKMCNFWDRSNRGGWVGGVGLGWGVVPCGYDVYSVNKLAHYILSPEEKI